MKHLRAPLAICVLVAASPASAQEVEWARWGSPVWIVSRDATGCSARPAETGDADTVVREDVSGAVTYRASGRDWPFTDGASYDARLVQSQYYMGDVTVAGRALGFRDARGWSGITVTIPAEQLTVFNSGAVSLFEGTGKPPLAAFPVISIRHRCVVELGRIDHGSGKPVVTRPVLSMTRPLITNDDYPAAAIRAEQQGTTNFAVTVSAQGLVSACEITGSSGSALLDDTSCNILSARAQFTPALDSDGHPTEAVYRNRFRWELPRDPDDAPAPAPK